MSRTNRNMKRISAFVPAAHLEIMGKLAHRKGLTTSDILRIMLKKYLQVEVKKIKDASE